ncbi:nucleosome assembly, partial [Perkinsus olseni]
HRVHCEDSSPRDRASLVSLTHSVELDLAQPSGGSMSAPAAASAEEEEAPTLPQELVSKLLALDDDYTKIQKRLEREIRELERTYDKELTPIIEARAQLLAEPGEQGSNHVKGFWKKVLRNSTEFEDDVEEWDLPYVEWWMASPSLVGLSQVRQEMKHR